MENVNTMSSLKHDFFIKVLNINTHNSDWLYFFFYVEKEINNPNLLKTGKKYRGVIYINKHSIYTLWYKF